MNALQKTQKVELAVANSMIVVTADRIFDKGKDADDESIGSYSKGYLRTRVKNNYPSSKKVILQATRQMVNDFSIIHNGKTVGIGFKNSANSDKSEWVENTYDKDIFKHTNNELKLVNKLFQEETHRIING